MVLLVTGGFAPWTRATAATSAMSTTTATRTTTTRTIPMASLRDLIIFLGLEQVTICEAIPLKLKENPYLGDWIKKSFIPKLAT